MAEGAIFLNSGPLFNGERLEQLEDTPEWADDESARVAYDRIRETFEKHATLLAGNPAVAETRFFMLNPTLSALGFTYSVHEPLDIGADRTTRIDYAAFAGSAEFYEALPLRGTPGFFHQALLVVRAMEWGNDFSPPPPTEAGEEAESSPADDMDFMIRTTGCECGILTNGCDWRLYHRTTSALLDTFFQADMIAAMKSDYEDFKRFFLLFRKEAFIKDDSGTSFIDRFLQ